MSTSPLLAELEPVVGLLLRQRPADQRALALTSAVRMAGGAINQNFLIELIDGHGHAQQWVLRRAHARPVPGTHGRVAEYRLFEFAHQAGLKVPEPLALLEAEGDSVSAFRRVKGEADPRSILAWFRDLGSRSPQDADRAADLLARAMGAQLGMLHKASEGEEARRQLEPVLGPAPACSLEAALIGLRASLGLLHAPASYLRYAVEQLIADLPQRTSLRPAVLCHNDFRLGNLVLTLPEAGGGEGAGGAEGVALAAVLDWEFAHWSDPMADLGWLTAPCWRFGGDGEVAGMGSLHSLLEGYLQSHPEASVPMDELHYWQRFAQIRWALIAAHQGERAGPAEPEALELRITGAMAASLAQPVVEHYLGHSIEPMPMPALQPQWGGARELLQAASYHLRSQMPSDLAPGVRYATLMASNAIRLAYNHLLVQSAHRDHPEADQVELDLSHDLAIWTFRGFP